MRVLFLGNHTVGIKALEVISETEEVVGVIAHPPDPEDGARYLSVYDYAIRRGWKPIRSTGKDRNLARFIRDASPELLWITDYRYLLPDSLLGAAPLGVINLHPSLLPRYRGRAPINWAILRGETTLGLTAHFVDGGLDTGDIISQMSFELGTDHDVGDALEILYPLYYRLTKEVLGFIRRGRVPRTPQDHSQATRFSHRRPEDGRIDWHQSVHSIWNLVRAVSSPYPGAFTTLADYKLTVWKAQPSSFHLTSRSTPGAVLDVGTHGVAVQCGDGILSLTSFELDSNGCQSLLKPGVVLGL